MRIVIAGNYSDKKAGANFYATVRKITNGFIRNGHAVMPFSDRDVAREQSRFGVGRAGDGLANSRLVELCRNFRPDLLLLLHADKIRNDTLREIRAQRPGLRIAVVNLDPLFLPENPPRIRRFAEAADITFITTAGERLAEFATPSHRIAFMPNPADRSIEALECFARNDQPFDLICTIGSEKGTPWRGRMMREIEALVPEARYAFYGLAGRPAVYGSGYFDAIADAKMGLNLNRSDEHYLYSSDRLAQYMGNGLLVFVGRSTGYDEIFAEDEMAFYEDMDDLAHKLRHFLTHDAERQAVARKGHAKYHAIFNERIVARFIEEAAWGARLSGDYAWPAMIYGG